MPTLAFCSGRKNEDPKLTRGEVTGALYTSGPEVSHSDKCNARECERVCRVCVRVHVCSVSSAMPPWWRLPVGACCMGYGVRWSKGSTQEGPWRDQLSRDSSLLLGLLGRRNMTELVQAVLLLRQVPCGLPRSVEELAIFGRMPLPIILPRVSPSVLTPRRVLEDVLESGLVAGCHDLVWPVSWWALAQQPITRKAALEFPEGGRLPARACPSWTS